jgi:hypothetical protein
VVRKDAGENSLLGELTPTIFYGGGLVMSRSCQHVACRDRVPDSLALINRVRGAAS